MNAALEWPADHVERMSLADLLPYARNAKTHPEAQVAQLAASMREWGWTMPVLIDENGTIIAGHGRVLAAQRLEWTEVPVMIARGWTPAQVRAYRLADNRLAENSPWNMDLLAGELDDLRDLSVDLQALGFRAEELNELIGTANVPPLDSLPELPQGERGIQEMTFLLRSDQVDAVNRALALAKDRHEFAPEENSNGCALAIVAKAYLAEG
jgi:ParB-like chromosome segregation protein Spo0J